MSFIYSPAGSVTVTTLVSFLLPSFVVTVIVASPAATPVTTPLASTVAVASALDSYDTVLSVALEGATVAVKLTVLPTSTLAVLGATVTPVTLPLVL